MLDLFWGDPETPVATNDDAYPGAAFLSVLRWHAPGDGVALVRVGPRTGGLTPAVFDDQASSYRFAAVLAESDLARQIEQRIAQQVALPSPTPTPARPIAPPAAPAAAPASAPPPRATPAADAPKGIGVATTQTSLRAEPEAGARVLQELPQGAEVELLGQSLGPWVRVQPTEGVVPGWVYGPDLRRAGAEATSATAATPELSSTPDSPNPALTPSVPRVRALEAAPLPPATPSPAHQRVELVVELVQGPVETRNRAGLPRVTPQGQRPLGQVRVQLVTVFGDVLAEALTGTNGQVRLSRELAPGVAAYVQVPVLGIQTPIDARQPVMRITVPERVNQ